MKANYSKNGETYTLIATQKEGANYKWVNCLALVDNRGQWMVSTSWRTNHFRKAHDELLSLGYVLVTS